MKYIIDLKGLESANIQVNGTSMFVVDGQEVSEVVFKSAPKFVKEVAEEAPKKEKQEKPAEKEEPKEELLIETPSKVEVEITAETEETE